MRPFLCLFLETGLLGASAPGLSLHTFQDILIRIPEEDGCPSRFAGRVGHLGSIEPLLEWLNGCNAQAGVPVAASMLWPPVHRVGIWQYHQVDHFRADPQPGTIIWKLVIGPVWIHVEPCSGKPKSFWGASGAASGMGLTAHKVCPTQWANLNAWFCISEEMKGRRAVCKMHSQEKPQCRAGSFRLMHRHPVICSELYGRAVHGYISHYVGKR